MYLMRSVIIFLYFGKMYTMTIIYLYKFVTFAVFWKHDKEGLLFILANIFMHDEEVWNPFSHSEYQGMYERVPLYVICDFLVLKLNVMVLTNVELIFT